MKKKHIILLALTIALILATSINGALAYFTTYARAEGGYVIHLGGGSSSGSPDDKKDRTNNGTEMREEFSAWTKHIVISNSNNNQPVYVRARAFSGSTYDLLYNDDTGKWTLGDDGYFYYNEILAPGTETAELLIRIQNVPADVTDGDSFNVVVIYECTPVQYDQDGNPHADWNLILDTSVSAEGGGN